MKNDPKNYEKMSAPHESPEAAQVAMDGFFDAVRRARQKYRIADVLVVLATNAKGADGQTQSLATYGQYGNSAASVPLALHVVSQERLRAAAPLLAIERLIEGVSDATQDEVRP